MFQKSTVQIMIDPLRNSTNSTKLDRMEKMQQGSGITLHKWFYSRVTAPSRRWYELYYYIMPDMPIPFDVFSIDFDNYTRLLRIDMPVETHVVVNNIIYYGDELILTDMKFIMQTPLLETPFY